MPRKNEWASRFGAARKARDKAYCAAAEAAIALESVSVAPASVSVTPVSVSVAPASPHQTQLDELQNERRRELDRLTGNFIRTM